MPYSAVSSTWAVWRSASRIYRRFPTLCAGAILRQRTCWPANGSCNGLDILRRTAPPQKTGLLTPRPRISEREYLDEAALASELETAQHINELAADVNRLTAKETQLRSEQAALTPWRSLDIPLELTETRWCDITTGTLPPFAVWDEIQGTLSQQVPESEAYLLYADRAAAGHPAADPQGRDGSGAGAAAQLRFLRRAAQGPPWYAGGKPDGAGGQSASDRRGKGRRPAGAGRLRWKAPRHAAVQRPAELPSHAGGEPETADDRWLHRGL